MKTLIAVSALFLASNMAFAEIFDYESRIASQDLDPNIPGLSAGISNPAPSSKQTRPSLQVAYRGNPDVDTGPVEPASIRMDRHDHIYTAYDMLVAENPDLEV
ncbi:hypothetical protein [Thiolapillus sp.]